MQRYFIGSTKSSPTVDFDPAANLLSLVGQSYPENAFKFYEPILEWVDRYLIQLPPEDEAILEFQMPYMNTSSTKCLMMLLDKFDSAYSQGKRVAVRWMCNADNESEYDCAEELNEDLRLPFDILTKEVG